MLPHYSHADAPIRVLLIDDRVLIRTGLAHLLIGEPAVVVVGQSNGLDQETQAAGPAAVDIVLLHAAARDGLVQAISEVRSCHPGAEVVLYDVPEDGTLLLQALQLGIKGFADSAISTARLVELTKRVAVGELVVAPRLARQMGTWLHPSRSGHVNGGRHPTDLSDREIDVLRMIATGATNRIAGDTLGMSENTVRAHMRSISRKLGVQNRVQATSEAHRRNLIPRQSDAAGLPRRAGMRDG